MSQIYKDLIRFREKLHERVVDWDELIELLETLDNIIDDFDDRIYKLEKSADNG